MATLQVFLGTKAQYIKTAPLLRMLGERGVPYRLIDSGQHARISATLRAELGIADPALALGSDRDVTTISGALRWAIGISPWLVRPRELRHRVFGGETGICVVHGDTPSTLLAALLARRAGLTVAHLEAGLRSHSVWHPFPEEFIRLAVMRISGLLFAPDGQAEHNLAEMGLRGRVVPVAGNTSIDALRHALAPGEVRPTGPVVATMHRVENLHRRSVVTRFVELLERVARDRPVTFVVHGPTADVIARAGLDTRLDAAGVVRRPLVQHQEFARMLAAAPFVVTDGGSIQEECALLGVPTLLWRARTERSDGLGTNVVLSGYHPEVVEDFLAEPDRFRTAPRHETGPSPVAQITDVLVDELDAMTRRQTAASAR